MERLKETGEVNNKFSWVEIPKENPIESFKAFAFDSLKEGLFLNRNNPSAEMGKEYIISESAINNLKYKNVFILKDWFFTSPLSKTSEAYSSVLWVKSKVYGLCMFFNTTSQIVSQSIILESKIGLETIDLHPMTASYLLRRTDLNKEEIENCKRCLKKDPYKIYCYFIGTKQFDLDLFLSISSKELKIILAIIEGIKNNFILLDKISAKKELEKIDENDVKIQMLKTLF